MTDANKKSEEVITVDPSINEETKLDEKKDSSGSNAEKEGLLKEIQIERNKRHETEARLADLESKFEAKNPNSSQDEIDLDLVAEKLSPIFLKKGFITREQKDSEDRADQYAKDLKDLSSKYDGKDGRPVFDASEVANYAKETGIFNLEAAYKNKHWKELVDFEKKQTDSDIVETEKPNSTNNSKPGERVKLTSEFLKERRAQPDGAEWYEKNRDKILAAMNKGQL